MSGICEHCGARFDENEDCNDHFSLILAKEFENPEYGAAHHLSVPCYYLQHNLYSKDGWLAARELLRRFVCGELTPEAARREGRAKFDGDKKAFSMTKGEKLTEVDGIKWSFTIADVRLESAVKYCADVTAWTRSVVADTEHLKHGG